jgi:hypothetical protein
MKNKTKKATDTVTKALTPRVKGKPRSKIKPAKKPAKKKNSKSKYKTGIHISPKCIKPINYRSSWELSVCNVFDEDPDVLCYSYESVGIPYRSPNIKSTKIRRYFPDFFVTYTNGKRAIIEVKRDDRIANIWTQTKAEACKQWAQKEKIQYQIWGAAEIAQAQFDLIKKQQEAAKLKLIQEQQLKEQEEQKAKESKK